MDAQLQQLLQNLIATNPQAAALFGQIKPVPAAAEVPPSATLSPDELTQEQQFKLFYVIFKEFMAEEEGKEMAAVIGKFARFAQRRADTK